MMLIELRIMVASEVGKAVGTIREESFGGKRNDVKIERKNEKLPANLRIDAESRRINPLRLLMSKPRISPLYLINGTVCRFVNFQPVCTTLSTTGLSGK
jgi:hypothetical protein